MKRWTKELGKVGGRQLVDRISLMLQRYRGLQKMKVEVSGWDGVKSNPFISYSLIVIKRKHINRVSN